ncbi:MAG TPA: anaerobic ribonucleoside-triphosphate reductase activating protein [Firmicutes bacterium]|jgi:anaerobic ribonucleoside-triphosphate reductase activating protein|nr:anaerobic ribonucleoside-triphosphate reductase activating protein [Bacillota bacterium]
MLDSMIRIAGIANESVVDGPGLRSTIFFQGCRHGCKGCHNPETWDPEGGSPVRLRDLIPKLRLNPLITGVTFSGGEPFLQAIAAAELGCFLKEQGLNLWVYTGYKWEYLLKNSMSSGFNELLNIADVLVDGPFQIENKSLQLPFRGSGNQRLIQVSESIKTGEIIQWQPTNSFVMKI